MTVFRWYSRLLLLAVVAVAASPAPISACDYGYRALPELFDASTDVFVGTVTDSAFSRGADGRILASGRRDGASTGYRFKVRARYKGAGGDEVVLDSTGSDCEYPFLQGATYVVHAFISGEGRLVSGSPSRPIVVSLPDGSPATRDTGDPATLWSPELAIAYADARARRRPHAFVQGSVHMVGRDGVPAAARPSEDVTVYAERVGAPTATVRGPNTPWNVFEIVLAPGKYSFRVRLNGVQLGDVVTLSLANGESRTVNLGPGWPH